MWCYLLTAGVAGAQLRGVCYNVRMAKKASDGTDVAQDGALAESNDTDGTQCGAAQAGANTDSKDATQGSAGGADMTQESAEGVGAAQADGAGEVALPKSDHEKQEAARVFAERWKGAGEKEIADTQTFWGELLRTVFGVKDIKSIIQFEKPVYVDAHKKSIDGFITLKSLSGTSRILIEQKNRNVPLNKKEVQSDGAELTPFEQGKRYADWLGEESPRWIVVCNFNEFWVYDMKKPSKELGGSPEVVKLADFEREWYRLTFLADPNKEVQKRQEAASRQTGSLIGGLYDLLVAKCLEPHNPDTLKSLNIFCVRLVFCFYAEDTGLFGDEKTLFDEYVRSFSPEHLRDGLKKLFVALDTPAAERDRYDRQIAAFPYVDGGLFSVHDIEIPYIDGEVKAMILECGKADWSEIDPVIFGSIFESTLNPTTRREGGMHYTAPGNIDRVLDPLFMDDLVGEFESIKESPSKGKRKRLEAFQDKLAALKFLDPACGSGNFLTRAYARLRTLENEAIEAMMGCPVDEDRKQAVFADESFNPVKVSLAQFWGIEINDFAVSVAKTALWIAERQMLQATERLLGRGMEALPISTQTHIAEGNALTLDWGTMEGARAGLTVKDTPFTEAQGELCFDDEAGEQKAGQAQKAGRLRFDYIMGNPPFVGGMMMSQRQHDQLAIAAPECKNVGEADYVVGWYYKAAGFIKGSSTRCAFVSTNSITQGQAVANVWKPLFKKGVHIDFAWRTFKWQHAQSEEEEAEEGDEQAAEQLAASKDKRKAKSKEEREKEREFKKRHKVAAVHCVVVGFSSTPSDKPKVIYEERVVQTSDGKKQTERVALPARNINGYLLDAPCVFVESRKSPLCKGAPKMRFGSMARDGGFLIIEKERVVRKIHKDSKDEKGFDLESYDEFVKREPKALPYIKRLVGSEEYINGKERWCLWLVGVAPELLDAMPLVDRRASLCRRFRQASKAEATQKFADADMLFCQIAQPSTDYLIVPCTSSEKRKYIPMGFLPPDVICSNAAQLIAGATLYDFGILTSSVHMAWMRAVAGRLKSDYRYSKDVVYNTFVWPKATDKQRQRIEKTAQAILDARANHLKATLAMLYGEKMYRFADLVRSHEANDRAVLAAYGWGEDTSESDIVAHLMELYQQKAGG